VPYDIAYLRQQNNVFGRPINVKLRLLSQIFFKDLIFERNELPCMMAVLKK
jgi:hypothetical protein